MDDLIRKISTRNDHIWLKTRQDIKSTLGIKISQQEVYDIVNQTRNSDRVAPCGKTKSFMRWDRGYQFCHTNCDCAKAYNVTAREKTNLERYGSKNVMGNSEIRDRFKKSMMENYGVEHPSQSPDLHFKAIESYKKNDISHQRESEENDDCSLWGG